MPADELNDLALAALDAGDATEASRLFAAALDADPRHPAAVYNSGLLQWRAGRITDEQLVDELDEPEMAALRVEVLLERGEPDAALLDEVHMPWLAPPRSNRDLPDMALAYTADGRVAVTGHADRVLRVWRDGALERELTGAEREIRAVVVDGDTAYAAGRDAVVRRWDLATGALLGVLNGHERDIMALALGGDLLASGGYDRALRLWRPDGEPVAVLPQDGAITGLALSATGLALVGLFEGFRLWNVRSGELLRAWPADLHADAVAFTPDGRYAIGTDPRAIHVWDVHSGREVRTLRGHRRGVRSLAVTPDGRHLLTGGYDGTARYWELTGRCLRTYAAGGQVAGVWVAADGRTARTGAVTGIERRFKLPGVYRAPAKPSPTRTDAERAAHARRFEELLAAARRPGADALATLREARAVPGFERDKRGLLAWQELGPCARTGLRTAWTTRTLTGHTAPVVAVALDRRCAVTGSWDGTARVWSGAGSRVLGGHEGRVDAVAVHDSTTVLTGGQDKTARFWRADTGECTGVLDGLGHAVWAVAFSPDGRLALVGTGYRRLLLVDPATAGIVAELTGPTDAITTVAFSAGGQHALSGGYDGVLRLWSIPSGELLNSYPGHKGAITSAAFGTDFLVSAGHDHTLRRWAPVSGDCTVLPGVRPGGVNAVSVTGDGRYVLTAGRDPKLRVYSTLDGRLVRTLSGHTGEVQAVDLLAPDWNALSESLSGEARLWYLDWDLSTPS
ncbi:WD40 repeat domain-containing protein [Dactylosporangium matsuzakiense]|uniref:WD40 repeat protein n=1 Tax=Dactylosporangium matsuzakiense TaxID=53360 RepID=A0A9W6KJC3_9ACTN|nr:WD40 repeat domain-containing protein [Dactylosporangium matsuzakiense]UWZ47602.1 WD40 repeat domain-containing protein [Dactylosporangium matsuzakiense]GLL01564.1 hypothetical protein GCM10017581_033060 [Dactylosporangium matsuzakiense]